MALLIQKTTDTPIRPKDIDTDDFWEGTFDDKVARAAFCVVRFCQSRRSWAPFQLDPYLRYLSAMFSVAGDDLVTSLVNAKLVQLQEGVVTLTTAFVATCYNTAPVRGLPRKKSKKRASRIPRVSKFRLMSEDPFSP